MPGGGHTVFQVHEETCFDALALSAGIRGRSFESVFRADQFLGQYGVD